MGILFKSCVSATRRSGYGGSSGVEMIDRGTLSTNDFSDFSEQEPPFGNMYPYTRLILTDLEQQQKPTISMFGPASVNQDGELEPKEPWSEQAQKLYDTTNRNTKLLCDLGAAGPFFKISGFSGNRFLPFDHFAKMWGYKLGLVFWGSLHWGSQTDETTQGFKDSDQFKTNAWESMSWLAGSACIMMTFHACYKVDFWSPRYNTDCKKGVPDTRETRQLVVAPAYFRKYTPIGSGRNYSELHGNLEVMISILVPARFKDLITYRDGVKIDVGTTMLKIYRQLGLQDEYAIELGGQTFALSMELHLAKEAQLNWQKAEYRRSMMEVDEPSVKEVVQMEVDEPSS